MEGASSVRELAHDNKENIIPASSALSLKSKAIAKNRRRKLTRKPLRDITNLFINQISSSLAPIAYLQDFASSPPSAQISDSPAFNLPKRKISELNQHTISKQLRMNFR
ncbi:hypothetical protein DCAR_0418042 [Daucus carota subsp. sativus]|uniref:Uncharacterized protein n=1 Tax=Daucus carota subsp. sativus TaxID=79200 RepID=A0A165Z412_DAUCS|nr:hypothetical protein DCAR_0418042 [Daucus carota subsp. sativus]